MVIFNASILNRVKTMAFFVNIKEIYKHNAIFNKTATRLVTNLTKCFFSIPEPCKLT